MYNKMRACLPGILSLLLAIVMFSCDQMEEDELVLPTEDQLESTIQGDYIALPGSPILINLANQIKSNSKLSFQITDIPKKGTVNLLKDGVLQYVSNANFRSGNDSIGYEISGQDGKPILKDNFIITITTDSSAFPCPSAIADEFSMKTDSAMNLYVLKNDRFCGTAIDSASFTIVEGPQHGTATIKNNSSILYQPESGYTGTDELIYEICTDSDSVTCLIAQVNLRIGLDADTCALEIIEDHFMLDTLATDTVIVDVLANDKFCFPKDTLFMELLARSLSPRLEWTADKRVAIIFDGQPKTNLSFGYVICSPDGNVCGQTEAYVTFAGISDSTIIDDSCTFNIQDDHFYYTVSDTASLDSTTTYRLDIFDNDAICTLSDTTLTVVQQPTHGTIQIQNNAVYYKPADVEYIGQDELRYRVCTDPDTLCQEAQVILDFK